MVAYILIAPILLVVGHFTGQTAKGLVLQSVSLGRDL